MIVFDLVCHPAGHVFEAWFANSASFDSQQHNGLLLCPLCQSQHIAKAVMAPRIGAKSNQRPQIAPTMADEQRGGQSLHAPDGQSLPAVNASSDHGGVGTMLTPPEMKSALAALAKAQREMLARSQWVGRDFSRQARAMDAGDIEKASIYGEASLPEVKSLLDDGIDILPLPMPVIPPGQSN